MFWELKEGVLVSERIVLQTLAFDLSVEHPYRPLLSLIKKLQGKCWHTSSDGANVVILAYLGAII